MVDKSRSGSRTRLDSEEDDVGGMAADENARCGEGVCEDRVAYFGGEMEEWSVLAAWSDTVKELLVSSIMDVETGGVILPHDAVIGGHKEYQYSQLDLEAL